MTTRAAIETPFPSVIILSYNTRGVLVECVRSVLKESRAWGKKIETIVVDNGSTDGSPETIRKEFPEVIVIENRDNLGFARGNNRGIRESHGDPVIVLNSDTVLMPEFFSLVEKELERGNRTGIIAPRLLNTDGTLQVSAYHNYPDPLVEIFGYTSVGRAARRLLPWVDYPFRYAMTLEEHAVRREVAHVKGACLIMKRALLDDTGGFDEDFFLYREETDLCKRARACGWKITYVPEIYVYHHHKVSSEAFSDKGLTHRLRSHYLYLQKHHVRLVRWMGYSFFLIHSLVMAGATAVLKAAGVSGGSSRFSYHAKVVVWHLKNIARCLR